MRNEKEKEKSQIEVIGKRYDRGVIWLINLILPSVVAIYWLGIRRMYVWEYETIFIMSCAVVFICLLFAEIKNWQFITKHRLAGKFWKRCQKAGIMVKADNVFYCPHVKKVFITPNGVKYRFDIDPHFTLDVFKRFHQQFAAIFKVSLESVMVEQIGADIYISVSGVSRRNR